MEVANASLLDEATAAAAMTLLHRVSTRKPKAGERSLFLVSDRCFLQTIEVLRSRAEPLGIDLHIGPIERMPFEGGAYGALPKSPTRWVCWRTRGHSLRPLTRLASSWPSAPIAGTGHRHAAGRDGRRRRVRHVTAIRCAARFRRSARRLLRHAPVVRAPDAGRIIGVSVDAHGRIGAPHGAGHTRAAHPPREGDVEHLHGAGPAGQHRGDVCRLSRS